MFSSPALMTQEVYRTDVRPVRYQQYIPAEAPQGMSYAAFLRSWTDDYVARWLHDIKCASHQDIFRANDIRGDVLLDLDQKTLHEMGVASIGDRLRILNAVKILRQKVSGKSPFLRKPTLAIDADRTDSATRTPSRRLENVRPAPLLLTANAGRSDLPAIQRDPDSARGSFQHPPQPTFRPLPTMPSQSTPPSNTTPGSAQSSSSVSRSNLPPLPPPPHPPPLPPQARPNLSHATSPSTANNWINQHLPADPRPGNPGSRRAVSPLPPTHPRPNQSSNLQRSHARNGSSGHLAPSSPTKRLPIANQTPASNTLPSHLSPIDEVFTSAGSNTPSPPTMYRVGSGPFNTPPSGPGPSSLDDLRKRLVKFIVPDEGLSFTIDVASCNGGVEVVEKVLKKVKNNHRADTSDVSQTEDGGLSVDGWGVYPDVGQGDGPGQPFTEAELLAICISPDHPLRENGLVLRRLPRTTGNALFSQSNRNTKRASSISILSDLGVRNPERALDAPELPLPSLSAVAPSGRLSPASYTSNARRPSKLRNFFGQRPPSELITNHLTEFFPNAEKKVLQRTARNSMMRRRESVVSYKQPSSRFSTSTQGSRISQPPPVPDKGDTEDLPRVSLSTDDGRSVDLHIDSVDVRKGSIPHLPPIPFPSASLSEFIDDATSNIQQKRMSRTMSTSSKRLSLITELRSKRDKSDTASLMTVDQITEAVESRRASTVYGREEDLDGWTKVDSEIESMVPAAVADDDGAVDEDDDEDDDDDSEMSDDEEDETLNDDAAELGLDLDDDGLIRNVMSAKRANKWIKGALIGAGSFGKVYLGMDASSGLLMAVKQVELTTGSAPNQERKKSMITALEREIELLQTLHHENIVQYLYSSIDEEFLNIFLEYVPGGSVTALLRNYGAFEEPLVKNFVRQISQGLNYLHERDIIHRDIKGANILVDNKGGVKISDFGISKKVDTLLTGNRMNRPSLQGSVFWMAPEVVKQSGHSHKADIWSVGCLIVEMLTGEHPWAQLTQMQAIFRIGSSATPTVPSDISSEAQDFLKQTFRIDHEARPSAAELLQHLWIATKA